MNRLLSLDNSFDLIFAAAAVVGVLATLQTFLIGQHYIIPTGILTITVLIGNIARYGLKGMRWAKEILFWCGFLFSAHMLMAIFFSEALPGGAWRCVSARHHRHLSDFRVPQLPLRARQQAVR